MIYTKKITSVLISAFLICVACNNGNNSNVNADSSPTGMPPDNNAAQFPSLADTMSSTKEDSTDQHHVSNTQDTLLHK